MCSASLTYSSRSLGCVLATPPAKLAPSVAWSEREATIDVERALQLSGVTS